MIKTGINFNHQNYVLDSDEYFTFSPKYKTHYKKLADPQNKSSLVTFLSGPAGTGKTCTLQAEFIFPLQSNNLLHYNFSFIPDKILDNHFFLKPIAKYLLTKTEDASLKAELTDFIAYYQQFEKEQPFNAGEINQRFIKFLIKFTQKNFLTLIFEDVHLAKNNFYDFLSQFEHAQDELFLNIICTTRMGKSAHGISPRLHQKWLRLDGISEKDVTKYIDFLAEKTRVPVKISPRLYSQSGGNPFYIKEYFYYNRQNPKLSQKIHAPYQPKSHDGKSAITSFRFHSLTKNEQDALKLLCLLGYSVDHSEAIEFLFEHGISNVESVLKLLQDEGFIRNSDNALSFQHHIYYESIKNEISAAENHGIQRNIFSFLYGRRSRKNIERLIHHASQAGLKGYSCILAKRFANELHKAAHYELASYYYNVYLENIDACSSPQKRQTRTIQALLPLHAISLILGDQTTEETISNYLLSASSDSGPLARYNIDAALTTSYWTTGHIQKARQFAKHNIQNALEINDRNLIITAKARYGALCSEVADFKTASIQNEELLSLFTTEERHEKFGMFISGHAAVTTVHSICQYELGNFIPSINLAKDAYCTFEESTDNFTRLYISAHAGYAMIMLGKHDVALAYLEKSLAEHTKSKATLIAAPALALAGLCFCYAGDIREGQKKIQESLSLTARTFKGSKKGIINLAWMESLLLGFRTQEFAENIDRVINETKDMSQLSHLGWLYFLKAVYHAFYQNSIQGFVGSYTKAAIIAENFDMKALRLNLLSLSNLESSGILSTIEDESVPSGLFDKARHFYDHTSNVKPISFHIQNRTRS